MVNENNTPFSEIVNKIHSKDTSFTVTGISIQYVSICERECWFYLNGIHADQNYISIVEGRNIEKESYEESETRIIDGRIAPDIMEDGKLLEIKRGSESITCAENQLLYYLWYFKKFKNDSRSGVIAIPKERKRVEVNLTNENKNKIENKIRRVWELWNKDEPPELEKKPVCSSCAYQDFCWR